MACPRVALRVTPRLLSALLVLLVASSLAACGSDDDAGGDAAAPKQPLTAKPADFPSVQGKASVRAVTNGLGKGPILARAVSEGRVGSNRIAFALFDRGRKRLDVPAVALYVAQPDGSKPRGPYVARKESSAVDTQYRSRLTAGDLKDGDKFYVADVPLPARGRYLVTGLVRLDGRMVAAEALDRPLEVGRRKGPPDVGDKAIRIHTRTGEDVGGNLEELTTRVPPLPGMLNTDFADVVGKKPVVLMFATPALCASRTCGPVVDIAEQARATSGKGVTFIQQEVYQGNDPNKGWQKQLTDWRLRTEPWAFVIDRRGRISTRLEGIFSAGELARAIQKVK